VAGVKTGEGPNEQYADRNEGEQPDRTPERSRIHDGIMVLFWAGCKLNPPRAFWRDAFHFLALFWLGQGFSDENDCELVIENLSFVISTMSA
jgi:hypothetical protein